jgi:hypothetical protein
VPLISARHRYGLEKENNAFLTLRPGCRKVFPGLFFVVSKKSAEKQALRRFFRPFSAEKAEMWRFFDFITVKTMELLKDDSSRPRWQSAPFAF